MLFTPDKREWWETVDVGKLSEYVRYPILAYVVEKYGRKRVREEAGISRVMLWRFLEKKSPVKPEYVKLLLKPLSREEFERLVTAREAESPRHTKRRRHSRLQPSIRGTCYR